jgi:hypothetical protein
MKITYKKHARLWSIVLNVFNPPGFKSQNGILTSEKTLAAIPETFLTAYGSLVQAMDVKSGQTLLIRAGTSSVNFISSVRSSPILKK